MALFRLGDRELKEADPPFVIAEIGANHNGELNLALASIDAAADAGADCAKFQTYHTDAFLSDPNQPYQYDNAGTRVTESMGQMFQRLQVPLDWYEKLIDRCEQRGLMFLSSAGDPEAVDLLARLGVSAMKLASEDLVHPMLLERVAQTGLPTILSTGMANETQIIDAIQLLKAHRAGPVMLLHCVSLYPTNDALANVQRMVSLRKRFDLPVGYSDHTQGIDACLCATALGALLLEKHFTIDRNLPGPDHRFSSDPDELAALVMAVKRMTTLRGDGRIDPGPAERDAADQYHRSLVASCDIAAGQTIDTPMLALKRPAGGLTGQHIAQVVGKRAIRPIAKNQWIRLDDLA